MKSWLNGNQKDNVSLASICQHQPRPAVAKMKQSKETSKTKLQLNKKVLNPKSG